MPTNKILRSRGGALLLAACTAGSVAVATAPAAAAAAAPPQANSSERAAAMVAPAIVYIEGYWTGYVYDETGTAFNNGQPYEVGGRCTGFGVNRDGYIATAGHCVADPNAALNLITEAAQDVVDATPGLDLDTAVQYGAANWTVDGIGADGKPADLQMYVQRGTVTGGQTNGAVPARVVDFHPLEEGDVALLKVEADNQAAVELTPDSDVQIGSDVLSVGYPASTDEVTDASLDPTNKDGQISAKRTVGSVPFYETSAALTQGMSGGPTVGTDGKVIGINSFMPSSENQAFNYIAPASGMTELLASNGVKAQLSENDRTYRQGLTDFFAGRYTDAIASFDKVLTLDPSHAKAAEFKTKAAQNREKFGDADSGSPVLPLAIGGGAAALLALAVLIVLLIRRRGSTGGPGGPQAAPAGGPRPDGGAPAYQAHQQPQPAQPQQPVGMHREFGYPSPQIGIPQQQISSPPAGFAPNNGMLPLRPAEQPRTAPPSPIYPPRMDSLLNPENNGPQNNASQNAATAAAPANPDSAFTRFCPSCGNRHDISARFCPNCGTDVS
jgi:serine protease Do